MGAYLLALRASGANMVPTEATTYRRRSLPAVLLVATLYIAHRAFFECGQFSQLIKMEEKATWRGPYAECDTFDLCDKFHTPEWINLLPPNQRGNQTFNSAEFDEELRRDQH